jgi:hypothetical protein
LAGSHYDGTLRILKRRARDGPRLDEAFDAGNADDVGTKLFRSANYFLPIDLQLPIPPKKRPLNFGPRANSNKYVT